MLFNTIFIGLALLFMKHSWQLCIFSNTLIRKCQTAHTRHHAQHIVVCSIDAHSGRGCGAHGVVAHSQDQSGVIDTRQVASAAGLVLLRLQREGIHVDAGCGHVGVVLEGLHLVEVAAFAHLEAVMAVQLQQGSHGRVLACHALHAGHGVARLQHRAVPPVRVVERLLALPGVHDGVIARHVAVALHHPHQLLTGVVEVQLDLVGGGSDGLTASELQHINQVLVGHLGELAALIGIQVDVVHIQRRSHQALGVHAVADGVGVGQGGGVVPAQVAQVVELQVDAHLVVLQSNQGQSQTRVAAEPELQRDIQGILGCALAHRLQGVGLAAHAVAVAVDAALLDHVGQLGHIAHHLGVTGLLAGLLGQLIPDVQPVTIVLVDALATDLNLHGLDQVVAHPVQPAELSTRAVSGQDGHGGQSGLQIHTVDQITVALDGAGHLLGEVGSTVEGVLDGLHGEVGVTTIHDLKDV